ncbi:MAG TPA: hypothetical protein PLU93_00875 [Treponemataceae bacterium]|nr:hypothetical protein [Treponemataceae bacterium]
MNNALMARASVALAIALLTSTSLAAEEPTRNGPSASLGLVWAQGDFGFQGSATSPWLLGNHLAFRASGFYHYRVPSDWEPYWGGRLGVVAGSFMSSANVRLYGDAGVLVVAPGDFDDDAVIFGGYGMFGFEFFVADAGRGLAYYLELGANGIPAEAEGEAGSPLYLNGFEGTVGLRYYF